MPRQAALLLLAIAEIAALLGPAAAASMEGPPPATDAAAPHEATKPVVSVRRLPRPPVLEEFLGMEPPADLRDSMTLAGGTFIQRLPTDGKPSSRRTDVWLGYDDAQIYAVFLAFDEDPSKIRAQLARRESVEGDDIVQIMLDTFRDERRAYSFICNPLGVQLDSIWTEGSGFDFSFDTVWQSRGRITDRGYVVWMAIPFKSFRFPDRQDQTWGILLNRDIPRDNEETFWPEYTKRIQGRLNQMGTLTGLGGVSPGRNLQFIPYVTGRLFRVMEEPSAHGLDFETERHDADVGIDAKAVIRDALVLDLTVNPDYSQVESDEPQITSNQRFERYYPEKRPFFIENAGYFATPINLVFTRRIADPEAGARLTGKAGPWAVGALVINDAAPGELAPAGSSIEGEKAKDAIARLARDVGDQSTIGLLATWRDLGGSRNAVAGADARIKWDDHWNSILQAVASRTTAPAGEGSAGARGGTMSAHAYKAGLQREGEHFALEALYQEIGPDFRADLGYIPRTDIRTAGIWTAYTFRPKGGRLLSWGPELFAERIEDHEGVRLDRTLEGEINFEFPRQTRIALDLASGRERLRPQDVRGLEQGEDYSVSRGAVGFESAPSASWSFSAVVEGGRAINVVPPILPDGHCPGASAGAARIVPGPPAAAFAVAAVACGPSPADSLEATIQVGWRPTRQLRFDLLFLESRLDDDASEERVFEDRIVRLRAALQVDPRLSIRAILERDTLDSNPALTSLDEGRRFNVDLLVIYMINPWTAFYVGWNSNWSGPVLPGAEAEPSSAAGAAGWRRSAVTSLESSFLGSAVGQAPEALRVNDARQFFVKGSYLLRF